MEFRLNILFFQFVLEYSEFLLSISGPKGISKNRKKYEKTKSIYKLLLGAAQECGQNLNLLIYEFQQPCSQLCYPSTPKPVRGFNQTLDYSSLYLVIISFSTVVVSAENRKLQVKKVIYLTFWCQSTHLNYPSNYLTFYEHYVVLLCR